jgi:putative oxidoreductase
MRDAKAIAIALLRTSMGLMFLTHVYLRLTVITWPVAVAFFRSLGFPSATAYAVTGAEATIGILLVIGWQVRAAALTGAVILAGATMLVHIHNGFLFSNAGGGWEYPAFWSVALLCQSMLGAGWTASFRWRYPANKGLTHD